MNRLERIAKIRILAERGATEGERAAARAALERLGETLEASRGTAGRQSNQFRPDEVQMTKSQADFVSTFFEWFERDPDGLVSWVTSSAPHHHGRVHFESG